MLNLGWLAHAALLQATAPITNEWWLATMLVCLMPAAFILLWVIVAWCFLSDQPHSSFR